MKTEPGGQPDAAARPALSARHASPRWKQSRRRLFALVSGVGVALAVVLYVARHAVVGLLMTVGLGVVTGDRVEIGSFAIGRTGAEFVHVRVTTSAGDPLLAVRRLQARYSLDALVRGRAPRYGLQALTLEGASLAIVRRADGSYNVPRSGAGGADSANGQPVAWDVRVRIEDSEIRLVDRAPVAPDLGEQILGGITINANVRSDRRSTARGSGRFGSRQSETSKPVNWPVALGATVDYPRGIAMVRVVAPALPLRGIIGFLQHSSAVRVDDGVMRDLRVDIFGLDIAPDRPLSLQIGGTGDLSGGRLRIAALAAPVRDLRGRVTLAGDGLWATRLDGTLAGVPVVARGGAYDRLAPTLRIGLRAKADLHAIRRIFAFAKNQPVSGGAQIETLLEAPLANLLIHSALQVDHGEYGRVPLEDVGGIVDYHAGAVVLDGVHGRYGPLTLGVGGRFLLGLPGLGAAIVATATGAGRSIPYFENVAPEATVDAVALIGGGANGYRAGGSVGVRGVDTAGGGSFAIDERGVGEFGPLSLERRDGSSLRGALRLERTVALSAAWIEARGFRVAVPAVAARLAGLNLPAFPPVAGVIDAELAGGGASNAFSLSGTVRGRDLRIGAARLGRGTATLRGRLGDVRLAALEVDGALGHFAGAGAAANGAFALRGDYNGSLERLAPLTGQQQARGGIRGPVTASLQGSNIVVQSSGATLHDGSVRGVELDRAAGTIAVRGGKFHLIAGSGLIAGRRAVASESLGRIAVSAPDISSRALRGTGLPLDAGNVSAFGLADLRGPQPRFDGTLAVAGGRVRGYRVSGDAQIALVGPQARVVSATGALGSTYGSIGGSIDGIGTGSLRYALDARVPLGDIELLRRDLNLSARTVAGSFQARLHVHGAGGRPFVDGRIEAPEGSYNGLAFRNADARLVLDTDGVAARDATVTVGSTRIGLAGAVGSGSFSVTAQSPAAQLADFNDYFDASDTLDGTGSFALTARTAANRLATSGTLDLRAVRYRDFSLGVARADWRMRGRGITGRAAVRSAAGTLALDGTVTPGGGDLQGALRTANYDARATFEHVELGAWLPALHSNLPVLGSVDARLSVTGRLPDLRVGADASLDGATIAAFAVPHAHVRVRSRGSRIEVLESSADVGFAKLSGNGRLGLGPKDPLAFDLRVTADNVGGAVHALVPAARGLDIAGSLDADVRLGGTPALPKLEGGFDLHSARYAGFVVPRAIGALALVGRAIELRDADVEFTHGQAFVAGSLPLVLQPFGLGPAHAPLSFDVTARGVDLAQFAALLPGGTHLGGTVDGRFGVEGSVDRPRLLGSLSVADGSYFSAFERAPIEHIGGNVAFAGSSIALQAFHADVGGGQLSGSGSVALPLGERTRTQYTASLNARATKVDFPAYGRGTVDGALVLSGGNGQPRLTGDLALSNAVIPVSAVYGGTGTAAGGGSGVVSDPHFQVHLAAGKNVRLRNAIVDIGVAGSVDLSGSLRTPRLAGGFNATDGTISSFNHLFRIVNAAVTFTPADGVTPTVDARAIARVTNPDPDPSRNIAGSATIIVTVSGTADANNLQVTYSSDPAYSQEQIIGLLLDVPALLGAVNFNLNGGAGSPLLRGAPGETNALLPPGVTPEQVSAISFNEEVFSLLNGQFAQRALTPIERTFERVLGLSDIEFTVDYGGGIGYSLRRQIGKRDFYAFLSQTVTYPERSNIGFELQPRPFQSVNFSYYQQNGVTSLITNQTPGEGFFSSTRRFTSVQPLGNRSGVSLNFDRRF